MPFFTSQPRHRGPHLSQRDHDDALGQGVWDGLHTKKKRGGEESGLREKGTFPPTSFKDAEYVIKRNRITEKQPQPPRSASSASPAVLLNQPLKKPPISLLFQLGKM